MKKLEFETSKGRFLVNEEGKGISLKEKTPVTIEELKEILQPMENKGEQLRKEAKKRGYTHDNFKCLINRELEGLEDINEWHYEEYSDTLYTMPYGAGGNVVYRNGTWAALKETLQEKEQRLLKELEEVRKEIEDSKIKVGDWVMNKITKLIYKVDDDDVKSLRAYHKKITNPQLIELLENESK